MPLQLFHELANQLCGIFIANVCWLSFKGVADANRDWHVRVLDCERWRRLLPLIIFTVRLKIVQDRVRVAFCLGAWQVIKGFPNFACPSLNHAVACLSEITCAPLCGFEKVFASSVVAVNDSFTILWETFFCIHASSSRDIETRSLSQGCIRQLARALSNALLHARTLRGECGFSPAWLLARATEEIL